jgi:hypothetical protein
VAFYWLLQNWRCDRFYCEWNLGICLFPASMVYYLGLLV